MTYPSTQKNKPAITLLSVARYLVPLIILGLAVHLILPQLATLEHSYQVIKGMLLWAVGLAIGAQVASYLGSGYLLKALVKISGSYLSILRGTIITLAGTSLGMVAGGVVGSSAAIYGWMQKEDVRPEAATLAGTIPGLFNDMVLMSVSTVGLVHLLIVHQLTRLQGFSFAVIFLILIGLIALLIWGLRKRESLKQLVSRIAIRWTGFRRQTYQPEKIDTWLNDLFKAADLLMTGGWRGPLLGAVLNVAFDMLTLYFLFIAAGNQVTFGVLLTGYGLPLLLGKMAFFIPGGVGVIESTMIALYNGLGVPNAISVVVVLVYRVLSFWLPLILGFPLILVLQRESFRFREKQKSKIS